MADLADKIAAFRDAFADQLAAITPAGRKELIKVAYQAAALIQIGEDAKPKMEEIEHANAIIDSVLAGDLDSSTLADLSIAATIETGGSDDPAFRTEVIGRMAETVTDRGARELVLAVALATAVVDGEIDEVEQNILAELGVRFDVDAEAFTMLLASVAHAIALPEKEEKLEALSEQSAFAFEGSDSNAVFDALARAGALMVMGGQREGSTKELPLLKAILSGIGGVDPDEVGRKVWDTMNQCAKMSREEVLESIRVALPEGEPRETCLVLAAAVCLVDGKLDEDEAAIYDAMAKSLSVPDDIAMEILRATNLQL